MKIPSLLFTAVLILLSVSAAASDYVEEGWASWYGGKFQGRQTASGEIFDTHQLTAAHKTLPFGTTVEVTNTENGKTVIVKINDRGPFVAGRIIDLSMAAAEKIGMVGKGIALVKIKAVSGPPDTENLPVIIQAAAYRLKKNGERAMMRLENAGLSPVMEHADPGYYCIFIPTVNKEAQDIITRLEELGFSGAFIRR
ncbi:MAG: septal ring lytic transglycosylase RlpA family protein [Spirochaetia bacterium]